MSDLSLQFQQAASQLPVSSYFDETLFRRELETIFQLGPRYVGHANSVPELGDYFALPQEGEGRALVRTTNGVELVSNVCRHRQAVMLKGRGNLGQNTKGHNNGHIVCPLHRWTYSGGQFANSPLGTLLGAPHFTQTPCTHLQRYPLRNWNGLLFEDNGCDIAADLANIGPASLLNFEGMVLGHVELHTCHYNWKTFIEVYLEDYHVEAFHPGLGNFVTCKDLQWEFKPACSVQTVGVQNLHKSGTTTYQKWHELLLQYSNGELPKQGAVWLTYYPHIMVEWYPHVLTISTLHPVSPDKTLNMVAFYYPEAIAAFEPELMQAQRAAYMETCAEDDEIAERMDAGRKALFVRGNNETGPYQNPMENGMQHFHDWYRSQMQVV